MTGLTVSDGLLILATLASPMLAVQAQKWVERARDKQQRRRRLFEALMATRAQRLSLEHVRALNMIDLEFYGFRFFRFRFQSGRDKEVCSKWNIYRDHLSEVAPSESTALNQWGQTGEKLLADLLVAMSAALGYEFDEVQIRRGVYAPSGHIMAEITANQIRDKIAEALIRGDGIPMRVTDITTDKETLKRQKEIQEKLLAVLDGKQPLSVTSVQPTPMQKTEKDN